MYLFYIGIYQQHIGLLRTNLIAVFMVDEVRRIICESIIPYCTQNKDKLSKKVQAKIRRASSILSQSKEEDSTPSKVAEEFFKLSKDEMVK